MARSSPPTSAPDINLMFRAFSDPTRLRILHILESGECCVGDLVAILQVAQPAASRHLAYLRKAKLVAVRKAGLWKYYSLARPESEFHQRLVGCLTSCFTQVPALQEDRVRAAELKKAGGCCDIPPKPSTGPRRRLQK